MTIFMPSICLDAKQINTINQLKPRFLEAQNATSVDWRALVGIWYRESFSVAPVASPGGQMQFDPALTEEEMQKLLETFSTLSPQDITRVVEQGQNDFPSALVLAACFLKFKTKTPKAGLIMATEDVLHALWCYNGKVGQKPEDSAYVYNGFDKDHFEMTLKGSLPSKNGKRKNIDIKDKRPGAFTVYTQLRCIGA